MQPFPAALELNLAEIFTYYARKYMDKVAGKDFNQQQSQLITLSLRGFSSFVAHFHVQISKQDISQVYKKTSGRNGIGFAEFKDGLQLLAMTTTRF